MDRNNSGPNDMIALGGYTGGTLCLYDPAVLVHINVAMEIRGYYGTRMHLSLRPDVYGASLTTTPINVNL